MAYDCRYVRRNFRNRNCTCCTSLIIKRICYALTMWIGTLFKSEHIQITGLQFLRLIYTSRSDADATRKTSHSPITLFFITHPDYALAMRSLNLIRVTTLRSTLHPLLIQHLSRFFIANHHRNCRAYLHVSIRLQLLHILCKSV